MKPGRATRRLGHYAEFAPPAGLRDVLDAVWVYARPAGSDPSLPGPAHRVLPETGVSLCFQCLRGPRGAVREGTLILMGPIHTPRFFDPPPGLHLEAVRLKPEWCADLLGLGPAEHGDALRDLVAVRPRTASRLLDRLAETTVSSEALGVLTAEIQEQRLEGAVSRGTILAHAGLERMRGAVGTTVDVAGLARDLGVSERHLRRVVRERGGAGPKRLQRIQRLNRAVARADRTSRPAWSRLAVETGFYDQAHLIGEFRALTGRTPARLHAERRAQHPFGGA